MMAYYMGDKKKEQQIINREDIIYDHIEVSNNDINLEFNDAISEIQP